jgi:hypothetical protein
MGELEDDVCLAKLALVAEFLADNLGLQLLEFPTMG